MPVFDPGVPWLRGTATLTNGSTTVTTDGVITLNEILEGDRLYVMDGGQRIGPLEIVGGEGAVIELRDAFEGATGSYSIAIDRNPITRTGAKVLRDMSIILRNFEDQGPLIEEVEQARDEAVVAAASAGYVFQTVAEVQSRHISPVLDSIRTNGYYTPGDGGGALYKRVASEPSHGGKIQSADGAWWELGEAVVNVLQFGAKRDAVPGLDTGTDDSAAFNALTEYLRESMYSSGPNGYREGIGMVRIVIPPGYYLMESSWNLTDFRSARNITIEGHGAVLIGKTPGYAVVDALDSRWLHFHGLTVHGSLQAPPRCGIQIGKTGQVTAVGNNALDEVRCMGSFELAAFANFGCETTTHRRCRYINIMEESGGTERFAYIGVGDFIVMPTSSVKSVTAVPGPVSFTQNSFYSCDFRNLANGSTLLITSSKAHYFDKGCYYVAFRRANVVLDHSLSNNEFLTLKGHFETNQTGQVPGAEGVQWLILWRGNGSDVSLPGFELETSTVHALSAVIRAENIGSGSRMSPAILRVPNFRPTSPSCLFFRGDGSTFTFVGEIFTDAEDRLNLGYLSLMSGSVYCRNRTRIVSWAEGTYTVYDHSPRAALTVGYESSGVPSASKNSVVASTLTFNPSVTFAEPGDLSVSYDVRQGYYTILPGNLLYVEVVLRFTPTYSTATGGLRVTGLPHSAALGSLRNGVINVSQMNNVVASGSSHIVGAIVPGSEEILLRDISGGSTTLLSPSHFPSGTEFTLVLSGLYKTADVV